MESLSQVEFLGSLVVALGVLIVFIKYFLDWNNSKNDLYTDIKQNLLENTIALRSLQDYLSKLESETKEKLAEHEKRLDEHSEAIIKLNSFKDIQINGGKNAKSD